MSAPFAQRLVEALEAHHESTLALQALATELLEHCQRMRSLTDRLHTAQQEIEPPIQLPRVLQGGPQVRGG